MMNFTFTQLAKIKNKFFLFLILLLSFFNVNAQEAQTYTNAGTQTYIVPPGVSSVTIQVWGGGGRGGQRTTNGEAGGGGGGAYSLQTIAVTPGQTLTLNVGNGSNSTANGGDSWVSTTTDVSGAIVLAKGGNSVPNNNTSGATGGAASAGIGTTKYSGGNGSNSFNPGGFLASDDSGAGGSSAGTAANGNNATNTSTGPAAPAGGGKGGNGATSNGNGQAGTSPGGGGGGGLRDCLFVGCDGGAGNGATGRVVINYTVCDPGTVTFALGTTSTRCFNTAGTQTYAATSTNATADISYQLDAASLAAGNTINTTTGEVTYVASWGGPSEVTATASCFGATSTATHTINQSDTVSPPVFALGDTSERCLGAGTVTYSASDPNATNIVYSLDDDSGLLGLGANSINPSTGEVTFSALWTGTSTITATATACNTAIATHQVVTGGPFVNDDDASGAQGTPLLINILDNDTCNIDASSVTITSQPTNGSIQINQDGSVTYLPSGFGTDTFEYQVCTNGIPVCDTATVTIEIAEALGDPCLEASLDKTYYLPFPQDTGFLRKALWSASSINGVTNNVRNIVTIKFPYPGTILRYDHWEDGYEADLNLPTQSTTVVWGDGDLTNGVAPGYATDIIPAGGYLFLDNSFPYNPRNSASFFFDGKDKMLSSSDIAVSNISGDAGGTTFDVQNVKTNVFDTSRFGQLFIIPFGEDVTLGGTGAFRYASAFIRASEDNTTVNLDYDGDGNVDLTNTLNEGEVWFYDGTASTPGNNNDVNNANDIKAGAIITADKPVGVDLVFGGIDSYGTRNLALLPGEFYGNTYYSPVYTSLATAPVYVFFTNSLSIPIDVVWTDKDGVTGTITVPANGSNYFDIPVKTTGYKFESVGEEVFTAVSVTDADASGSAYDWSYSLITSKRLTTFSSIAWAPGSRDLSQNYSPVWVTPTKATTLYIKYDGDLTATANTPLNPCGLPYDVAVPLAALEAYQVFDPDNDQTGLAVYTCNDVTFASVWGLDPNAGGPTPGGSPAQDVGYVMEPRCIQQLLFANDDLKPTLIATPVTIDLAANDTGFLANVDPTSITTSGLLQPANGTVVLNGDGTVTYTPNPGFEGVETFEYRICSDDPANLCDVATVRVPVTCAISAPGTNDIKGSVFQDESLDGTYEVGETGQSGVRVILYQDNNEDGVVDAGDTEVDRQITDANGNYSFNVTLPSSANVATDNFSSGGRSGGTGWNGNWTGTITSLNNEIRLQDDESITRAINMEGATSGDISFSYRGDTSNDSNDLLIVEVCNGADCQEIINTNLQNATVRNATNVPIDVDKLTPSSSVRVRVVGVRASNENMYVDNIVVNYNVQNETPYVLAVDESTLPAGNTLTTDNVETAVFTEPDISDCVNNFGIANLCTNPNLTDTDSDGINDTCDLDDDNDGILDINETCDGFLAQNSNGAWLGITDSNLTVNLSDGSPSGNPFTTDDGQIKYNLNSNGAEQRMTSGQDIVYTYTFSTPVPANELAFNIGDVDAASFTGQDKTTGYVITINGSLVNGDFISVKNGANTLNYTQSTGEISLNGAIDNQRIWLKGISDKLVTTFQITATNLQGDDITYSLFARSNCDTDNDGAQNYIDTDSDDDGCSDAVEASGNIKPQQLTILVDGSPTIGSSSENLGKISDSQGTPIVNSVAYTQTSSLAMLDKDDSIACSADLSLTKTVDKAIVKVGDIIIYTLTVKNNGPVDATGVQVTDVLPSGLTYNSTGSGTVIPLGTTYNDVATPNIWNIGNVAVNQIIILKIEATITSAGTIVNSSQITQSDQSDIDSKPSNDK